MQVLSKQQSLNRDTRGASAHKIGLQQLAARETWVNMDLDPALVQIHSKTLNFPFKEKKSLDLKLERSDRRQRECLTGHHVHPLQMALKPHVWADTGNRAGTGKGYSPLDCHDCQQTSAPHRPISKMERKRRQRERERES